MHSALAFFGNYRSETYRMTNNKASSQNMSDLAPGNKVHEITLIIDLK